MPKNGKTKRDYDPNRVSKPQARKKSEPVAPVKELSCWGKIKLNFENRFTNYAAILLIVVVFALPVLFVSLVILKVATVMCSVAGIDIGLLFTFLSLFKG